MDYFSSFANEYDSLSPKEDILQQQPFFERLIEDYSVQTCLDCACGTGWHLYMLADLGLHCSGSDASVEMLAIAKDHLGGRDIPLKQEDYRTLEKSWDQRFDMVICMSTSLNHMLTDEDVINALASMRSRLNNGGILVLSCGITDAVLAQKPRLTSAKETGDDAFYFFLEYPSPDRMVFNILHVNKTEEGFGHTFYSITYNALRRDDIDRLLRMAGFETIRYFGEFDSSEYSKDASMRMVVVAQR